MIPLYEFVAPSPPETTGTIAHDTGGWTLESHPGTHPSGRDGIVFDVPDGTPDGNGCTFTLHQKGRDLITLRGILYLHLPTGAGLVFDDWTHLKSTVTLPRLVAQGQFLAQDV
jgi:hypothetical protein